MTLPRTPLNGLVMLIAMVVPAASRAHFRLESPAAATQQSSLGDPQKAPPCGDDGSAVDTSEVTAYRPGDTLRITIDETIFHPGHYRVALALNDPSDLPAEPPVTPGNTPCGSVPIDDAPAFPVLVDGALQHTSAFEGPQSIEVKLPDDLTCKRCTLQVIEFMSDHGLNTPGGCFYHHCATIAISANGSGGTGAADANGETQGSSSGGCALRESRGSADLAAWSAGLGLLLLRVRRRRATAPPSP